MTTTTTKNITAQQSKKAVSPLPVSDGPTTPASCLRWLFVLLLANVGFMFVCSCVQLLLVNVCFIFVCGRVQFLLVNVCFMFLCVVVFSLCWFMFVLFLCLVMLQDLLVCVQLLPHNSTNNDTN